MKISAVEVSGRKKAFVIRTRSTEYTFPFAKLRLHPTTEDPVAEVFPRSRTRQGSIYVSTTIGS